MVEVHPALNRPPNPVCSVCIANYNGRLILDDCIRSVFAQRGDIPIEVLVHDDASTDESVQFLKENYPQVEILLSRTNVGYAVSNNRLAAHARGQYLLLLNNDAALHQDAISNLRALSQDTTIVTLPQFDWESGALVDRGCLLDPFYNPVPNLDPDRTRVAFSIGACLWMPRNLWLQVGGFPEWMESIGEDLYLCGLARLWGFEIVASTTSGYRHRQGFSFGGNRAERGRLATTVRRRRLSERNKTLALAILTPTGWMWPLLCLHLLGLAVEGIILGAISRDLSIVREVYLSAILAPFRKWRLWRSLRQEAMSRRRVTLLQYLRQFTLLPRKVAMLWRYGVPTITR
jgi:GT2 family glycosyltransferase